MQEQRPCRVLKPSILGARYTGKYPLRFDQIALQTRSKAKASSYDLERPVPAFGLLVAPHTLPSSLAASSTSCLRDKLLNKRRGCPAYQEKKEVASLITIL